MADLLSIGVSGLLAYRRVLDTTSNNIANANTAGYSRQRVELASRIGTGTGAGYIGGGVEAVTVQRSVDGFIGARLQSDASAYARLDVLSGFATRVDGLLSDADAGLSRPLQEFFDAANALVQDPASTSTRQALIGSAQTLAASFQDIQSQLDTLDAEINQRTQVTVEEINNLTRSIADLNQRIALGYSEFGQPPNDLLDQRDRLLEQLSTRVGITTYPQNDGSVNVFVGSGQTLVLGSQASTLGVADDAFGSGRLDIVAGGAVITPRIGGGTLGGLLDARREIVDPARAELGRLAVGIADSVNAQHALGVDLYGELGGLFFSEPQGTSIAAGTNAGNAAIGVGFSDVSQLGTGDYELRYDGAAWSLIDSRSGAGVALSGTGTSADPLVGAGLALVVSGTAAAGDRFRIQPTAYAAGNLGVAIADPARIAAAAPLRASAALGNTGTASAAVPVVNDATNASLLDTVEITFT
ncbi:MAG: flagellar hook-associated protein FlgK, partial [Gammaproteobacteria bacterium]